MMTWRHGVVLALGRSWSGAQELQVQVLPPPGDAHGHRSPATEPPASESVRALAYTGVVGAVSPGQHVLLNTTAQSRGLGTGGYALVVALSEDLPTDPPPGPGHIVKARYTPQQVMVLGVDEQESEHHELLRDADDLAGMPVVVADLHSAVPAVLAGARWAAAEAGRTLSVAYVMTDGGALPAAFSRTVAGLREADWLAATITTGQTYGGDLEAVTVHSGLLAAHLVCRADLVVLAQGPGNAGTGTRWGFSGVAAGEALNAAAVLGGRPVASLRVSGSDRRERHFGISHHSLTAIGRAALVPADVVVPELAGELGDRVCQQARSLGARHRLVPVPTTGLSAALAASPVPLSSMGRTLAEDEAPFLAAAAAGVHAARLVLGDQSGQPA
ncbi:MAG TPA: DUF3866 family protein [Candidatus Ruania gallistercoris]|uniref:DUF3866 family protein n=1 Tax=Candidatus Ruania gallistercoris TaxID=2838746 RepID=A0A9D2EFT7_9MICO|nr:DUF3866 family protein [Candidatus Ruania gallistercoris]